MKEIKIKVDDEQAKLIKEGKLTFALVETEAIEDAKKAEDADGGVVLITTKANAAEKVDSGIRPSHMVATDVSVAQGGTVQKIAANQSEAALYPHMSAPSAGMVFESAAFFSANDIIINEI